MKSGNANQDKISSWVFFPFLYEYGAPLRLFYFPFFAIAIPFESFDIENVAFAIKVRC